MNIESRKLFQNLSLSRVVSPKPPKEAALLPLVPGHPFETSDIAMNPRNLIDRLCFERFYGAIYFQGEDERGEIVGVALIEGASLTGALFLAGGSQWLGLAAWERFCALKSVLQCLILQVEKPVLEAYGALLQPDVPRGIFTDARKLRAAADDLIAQNATGALRVALDETTYVQFFHEGQSLGLYATDEEERLIKCGESFDDALPLPRRAQLEVWHRESQTLFRSLSAFDAADTLALARFLSTVFELGANLMPIAMARAQWSEAVVPEAHAYAWMTALREPRTLELTSSRRVLAFKTALKDARETPFDIVQGIGDIADTFLAPLARSVGTELFARQAAKAFSSSDSAILRALGVSSRYLNLELSEAEGAKKGVVLDAVAGARYSHTPRRVRTQLSTYDF